MTPGGDDRGSVTVEFVLVSLLLTALTLGVLQIGFALYTRNVLQDAAVEGAYVAARADASPEEGAARSISIVSRSFGDGYAVTAAAREVGEQPAAEVEVRLRATVPLVGVLGIENGWEVIGRAPVQSFGTD